MNDNIPQQEIEFYADDPNEWRRIYFEKRKNDFSVINKLNIMLVTYNINEKIIKPDTFKYILKQNKYKVDLIFVVVEEIDMSVSGFLKGNTLTPKALDLKTNIEQALESIEDNKYVPMNVSQLGGVTLTGFYSREIKERFGNLRAGYESVGAMGMANKGGIAFSFTIDDTSICIVGCHLAAHQSEIEKRNRNFHDIFHNINLVSATITDKETENEGKKKEEIRKIDDNNIIFWMGDLNYRIDEDDAVIREKIKENKCQELMKHGDQLVIQRKKIKLLDKFVESEITFQPTYKFFPNTNDYNEKRKPAYCDRILYKSSAPVVCLEYISLPDAMESDHKPVRGIYTIETSSIIEEKYAKVRNESLHRENQILKYCRPQLILLQQEFTIEIYPFKKTEVLLMVKNSGDSKIIAAFKDPHLEKSGDFPEWISISPKRFEIERTDKSLRTISFQFQFGNVPYSQLFKKGEFTYNLTLEIENGRIAFIPIKIILKPTSFNKSITELNTRLNGYVLPQPNDLQPSLIPKEIWRLCNHLYENISMKDKFTLNSLVFNSYNAYYDILLCLDYHREFDTNINFNRIFEFLYLFLMNLEGGMIPSQLYEQVVIYGDKNPQEKDTFFTIFESQIPPENRNLFVYMITFVRTMFSKNWIMDRREFINFISPCFIRPHDNSKRQCDGRAITNFLLHFIESK